MSTALHESEFFSSLSGKRVVLVGPAASLGGQGLGAEIDAYDVVVRMNMSYVREASLGVDYGTRTDALYHIMVAPGRALDETDAAAMVADGVQWLVSKWGSSGRNGGRLRAFLEIAPSNLRITSVDPQFADQVRIELAATEPHTGPLAIAHLLRSDLAELRVLGCDFYASGYLPGYGGLSADMVSRITEHAANSNQGEVSWTSGGMGSNVDRAAQMRMLARLALSDARLRLDQALTERIEQTVARMVTALVPMKSVSERLPGKNTRLLNGKPLCWYVLDTLSRSMVGRIVVDTDSEEIAAIVREHFPHITVLDRPDHLRGPEVNGNPLTEWEMSQAPGEHFLATHVTNPLLTVETVNAAIEAYFDALDEHDSLVGVTEHRSHFYDAASAPVNHDPTVVRRTQDLPPLFEDNHCLYLFSRASFAVSGRVGQRPQLFRVPRWEAVDIDYEADFSAAEALITRREHQAAESAGKAKYSMGAVVYSTSRQKDGSYVIRGAVQGRKLSITTTFDGDPTIAMCQQALLDGGVPATGAGEPVLTSPPEPQDSPASTPPALDSAEALTSESSEATEAPQAAEASAEVAELLDLTVAELAEYVAEVEDVELLRQALAAESGDSGKGRKTAIEALTERIEALTTTQVEPEAEPAEATA